jgi:hypothetical protein
MPTRKDDPDDVFVLTEFGREVHRGMNQPEAKGVSPLTSFWEGVHQAIEECRARASQVASPDDPQRFTTINPNSEIARNLELVSLPALSSLLGGLKVYVDPGINDRTVVWSQSKDMSSVSVAGIGPDGEPFACKIPLPSFKIELASATVEPAEHPAPDAESEAGEGAPEKEEAC